MSFYRVYACRTREQAEHRLQSLMSATCLERGRYHLLRPEHAEAALRLDPRFLSYPAVISRLLRDRINDGEEIYLFELLSKGEVSSWEQRLSTPMVC